MILIDATYINSFGGKTILELIISEVLISKLDCFFLFDKRLQLGQIKSFDKKKYTFLNVSHFSRKKFYLQNSSKFSSILCLSNIPPPITTKVNTTIYFHNRLLLNPFSSNLNLTQKFLNFLKVSYIKLFNQKNYNWIVQTHLVSNLLCESLKIEPSKVSVFPIFKSKKRKPSIKNKNSFVYVSSGVSHKNHKRLLKAFIAAAKKTKIKITLNLTLRKNELKTVEYPNNLMIIFHGTLNKKQLNRIYESSNYLIYPSLIESFGLPLIEAVNFNCKVLASNLPYVHQIIKPSLCFDPYSTQKISHAILKALDNEIDNTEILINNKLTAFIKFIKELDNK